MTPPGTFGKWSTGCAGAAQVNTARVAAQFCLSGLTFGLSTQTHHRHLSVFIDLMRYGKNCFKSFSNVMWLNTHHVALVCAFETCRITLKFSTVSS